MIQNNIKLGEFDLWQFYKNTDYDHFMITERKGVYQFYLKDLNTRIFFNILNKNIFFKDKIVFRGKSGRSVHPLVNDECLKKLIYLLQTVFSFLTILNGIEKINAISPYLNFKGYPINL